MTSMASPNFACCSSGDNFSPPAWRNPVTVSAKSRTRIRIFIAHLLENGVGRLLSEYTIVTSSITIHSLKGVIFAPKYPKEYAEKLCDCCVPPVLEQLEPLLPSRRKCRCPTRG